MEGSNEQEGLLLSELVPIKSGSRRRLEKSSVKREFDQIARMTDTTVGLTRTTEGHQVLVAGYQREMIEYAVELVMQIIGTAPHADASRLPVVSDTRPVPTPSVTTTVDDGLWWSKGQASQDSDTEDLEEVLLPVPLHLNQHHIVWLKDTAKEIQSRTKTAIQVLQEFDVYKVHILGPRDALKIAFLSMKAVISDLEEGFLLPSLSSSDNGYTSSSESATSSSTRSSYQESRVFKPPEGSSIPPPSMNGRNQVNDDSSWADQSKLLLSKLLKLDDEDHYMEPPHSPLLH
ncbi:hypothetical protein SeMB42_g03899 [Synchytrium endobioticum]|nr:hypothetical protein SeMB42_g03899 [Synchytrium endobioticum]